MRTFALATVLIVDSGLLIAVIVWPWLIAAGVLVAMRLSRAADGRDIDEVANAAVGIGMPARLAGGYGPGTTHRKRGSAMSETDFRVVGDRWSAGAVETPRSFMLIGRGGPNVLGDEPAGGALVVDAEGVQLRSGATWAWCHSGCCEQPRYWRSAEAAADFHGSLIVESDGTVRAPGDAVPGDESDGR